MSNFCGPMGHFELAALGGFGIVPGERGQRDSPISPSVYQWLRASLVALTPWTFCLSTGSPWGPCSLREPCVQMQGFSSMPGKNKDMSINSVTDLSPYQDKA